ncbi:MAG: BlaI/MecI/CopY family transcriptional regulator [Lachnospiraceae bacterium]|nr:BlaI/MecI/CopY family transcriptional regulator [Lachnospiraceae bacterium]
MKPLPQISEAEYEVMRIIWKYAPISTNEIVEKLAAVTSWNPKTIQTLIKRLVIKHAITYEKESRMFVYSPLVEEREYISQESNTFLKKYYDGNIATMLSAYLDNDKLSESEIDDLRKLLEKKS